MFGLIFLSSLMGVISFAAVSAMGMGILMGTSLIVIIPEGVETLYGAANTDNPIAGGAAEATPHRLIGPTLVAGFVLMYLIDKIPALFLPKAPLQPYIAVDSFNELRAYPNGDHVHTTDPDMLENAGTDEQSRRANATTTGLVIHAAADGIALGASSTTSNVGLEAIVFVAIMIHKAPAAFSLSVLLLKAGLTKRKVRQHLILFSLAAPFGAILTYIAVSGLSKSFQKGNDDVQSWTGLILLFSGGTFLYVATHAMQDGHEDEQGNNVDFKGRSIAAKQTGAAVFGMLLPLLTTIGHGHGH